MKIKLDENLGSLGLSLLKAEGHDVELTIAEQQMSGAEDDRIYEACRDEGRVLVGLGAISARPFGSAEATAATAS